MRATADGTLAEIHEYRDSLATLTARKAALTPEMARAVEVAPEASAVPPIDGVTYAQQCVADVLAGVRNYTNEMPEVQTLLRQLVDAIDALRSPQLDASQQTLQAVLAKQRQRAAAATEFHNIAIGNATPVGGEPQHPTEVTVSLAQSDAMTVDSKCGCEKRKRKCLRGPALAQRTRQRQLW